MNKIRTLFCYLRWKFKGLVGRRPFLSYATQKNSIGDYFNSESFSSVFLVDYQRDLIVRHLFIKAGLKRKYSKRDYNPKNVTRIELGALNENVLNHLASLYENSLKQADMIIGGTRPEDGFIAEMFDLKRRIYIDDKAGYAKEVARHLKGKRVLVVSRSAYLIKPQFAKFESLNPGASSDFKLLAINPFSEVILSSNGQYFSAFDELKVLLLKLDFDVVLFDDSLYALPLAVFASSLGKKALVLGDELLNLFGIVKTRGELDNKDGMWVSADAYKDDITAEFLATGQLPEIK